MSAKILFNVIFRQLITNLLKSVEFQNKLYANFLTVVKDINTLNPMWEIEGIAYVCRVVNRWLDKNKQTGYIRQSSFNIQQDQHNSKMITFIGYYVDYRGYNYKINARAQVREPEEIELDLISRVLTHPANFRGIKYK